MSEGHLQTHSERLAGRPFQSLVDPQLLKVEESAREAYIHGLAKQHVRHPIRILHVQAVSGHHCPLVKQRKRQDQRATEPALT